MMRPPAAPEAVRVRLEPIPLRHTLLDGSWWPRSADLRGELAALVPVLQHARGPVTRLLLGAAGWTARPHQIVSAGRPVSVCYLSGQSPALMTVLFADGGSYALRVDSPDSSSDSRKATPSTTAS